MTDTKYEYVILEMGPNHEAEDIANRLNAFGQLGFKALPPVPQGDFVIYTLYLEVSE